MHPSPGKRLSLFVALSERKSEPRIRTKDGPPPGIPEAARITRKTRQSRASASSFWIRETPSTRSSSPRAYDRRR